MNKTAEKIGQLVEAEYTMQDCKECFAVPESDIMIDVLHPVTGLTVCFGKTLEQVRAERPEYANAERMTVDEFCRQKAARQHTPITWAPTTEDRFLEMLEVLPPAAGASLHYQAFLVGEPWDHDAETGEPRFQGFRMRGDVYEVASRPMTRREFAKEVA